MAQTASLQVATRSQTGKGAARSLRREGKVPGVIYGHGREPESVIVDASALAKMLGGISAATTIVDVTVDGRAPVKALIREIQRDPIRAIDILHLDLYEVRADEAITVSVPIHFIGTPDGVRNFGGVLDQVLHAIEIEVLPANIPERLDIDVSALGIGASLHVSDIQIPNARILDDPELAVCSVVAPRTEEAPPAEEAASNEPELIRKAKAEEEGEGAEPKA